MEYETVSVAELFEEELVALEEQHEELLEKNTYESRTTAAKISHVIEYFKNRLGIMDEEDYLANPGNNTLH